MIRSFGSRSLRNFWERGSSDKVDLAIQAALLRRLDVLDAALKLSELRAPGLGLLAAAGKPPRDCQVHVALTCILRFDWAAACADDVRLQSSTTAYNERRRCKARAPARPRSHPGAVLREDVFPSASVSILTAAARMDVSRQTLHRIMAETASVTPDMAIRLGRLFGNGPAMWLRMQQAADLWRAEQAMHHHDPQAAPVRDAA